MQRPSPVPPQAMLVKILRRLLSEPGNAKFRRLKLDKLRGKLNGASLLALRNCGFVEESGGILCLPLGPTADASVRSLLARLVPAQGKGETSRVPPKTPMDPKAYLEDLEQTLKTVSQSAALAERTAGILRAADPSLPPAHMWAQHPTLWRESSRVLVHLLEQVLKEHPKAYRIPTDGVGGIASPLARANACPGALGVLSKAGFAIHDSHLSLQTNSPTEPIHSCLKELNARLSKDAEKNAKARASAIDRLAFQAMKKRKGKKKASNDPTATADEALKRGVQNAREAVERETKRLEAANAIINEGAERLGEAHRIEWTIGNWRLREIGDTEPRLLYAPNTLQDTAGRKWRAYAKKTPGQGRRDYGVGVFLECNTVGKLPAKVSFRVSLLHAHTHAPLGIPGAVGKPRQVTFSKDERAFGLARIVQTVEEKRLAGIGAYDPSEDRMRFRVDFAVKELPPAPIDKEDKKSVDQEEQKKMPALEERRAEDPELDEKEETNAT